MIVREPAVAGMFYQADPAGCRADAKQLFAQARRRLDELKLPSRVYGAIVPHAGWAFSGEPAAMALEAIARARGEIEPPVFVLLGAMHRVRGVEALLFDRGVWNSPLGQSVVDESLAQRLLGGSGHIRPDVRAHQSEHSIEVQIPLIQFRFPGARIVPILAPPADHAVQIGQAIGQAIRAAGADAVVIGSTDLTHYGPRYGFTPQGVGPEAVQWAKQVNDASLVKAVVELSSEQVVSEANQRLNACGAGAVAAAMAACRQLGASRGVVLAHVTSYEIMRQRYGQTSDDSVSYLSAVLA